MLLRCGPCRLARIRLGDLHQRERRSRPSRHSQRSTHLARSHPSSEAARRSPSSAPPPSKKPQRKPAFHVDYVAKTHPVWRSPKNSRAQLPQQSVFLPRSDRANPDLPAPSGARRQGHRSDRLSHATAAATSTRARHRSRRRLQTPFFSSALPRFSNFADLIGSARRSVANRTARSGRRRTRHRRSAARSRSSAHRDGRGHHRRRHRRRAWKSHFADSTLESSPRRRSQARMSFPIHRPRRLRRTEALRGLVRETRLTIASLIYPMFVCPGTKVRQEVSSMPGIFQQSADQIARRVPRSRTLGHPRSHSVRLAGIERPARRKLAASRRRRAARHRSHPQGQSKSHRHHRRLPLRIHRPRPLRRDRKR